MNRLIDAQIGFCTPSDELSAERREEDRERLIQFLVRNKIVPVSSSSTRLTSVQIFSPNFWRGDFEGSDED
jgi:hypothetical protein